MGGIQTPICLDINEQEWMAFLWYIHAEYAFRRITEDSIDLTRS